MTDKCTHLPDINVNRDLTVLTSQINSTHIEFCNLSSIRGIFLGLKNFT